MRTFRLAILISGALLVAACSTSSPTDADLSSAQNDDEYWEKRYEQQCIASGIKPGTPMLVKLSLIHI